jgi:hypothetical protein
MDALLDFTKVEIIILKLIIEFNNNNLKKKSYKPFNLNRQLMISHTSINKNLYVLHSIKP